MGHRPIRFAHLVCPMSCRLTFRTQTGSARPRGMRVTDPKVPRSLMTIPCACYGKLPTFDRLNHWVTGTPRSITPELMAEMKSGAFLTDPSRARDVLGWQTKVTLEGSLRSTLDQLRGLGPV